MMQLMDWFFRHSVVMWLLLQSFVLMTFCFHPAKTCPKHCYCSEGEKTVRCSESELTEIPKDIPSYTRKLYLDSNQITNIPDDAFRDLNHLTELDLSHNAITRVEIGAFHGVSESLQKLDLSSNNLVYVNKEVFINLKAKTNLSSNPWRCDCALLELIKTVEELAPASPNDITCDSGVPEEYIEKPFVQVWNEIDFCNSFKKTTDVAMLVTMFGWFTMVISYLVYYVRQNQEDARRHLEYLKSLPSKQGKSEESSTISTVV
ncbi:leucine-rich repeat-containing protein 3B [Latimeria chalumnae]|uniref:Leucine rich repeat containing 3C n=1 Tax=Latimeria chalumnae TaxID=7897 RepID=H3B0L8_LATCH|nr:PREDICTED: leucine-rich repeat-containing protein 3C [Latimeria chalumnae]XP_005999581.1 PREDICTED: leucine-rich repeat-containing protein 3C [Latimeria chalumnae]|eukprot:XP_005999580.1 PREDICTED: leucine-rich repeat-containing protein 3C [Latimeria chalumnae]